VSVPELSNNPPRISNGDVGPYGGRLLPICCPGAPSPTFGTTIRIARVQHPCCLSWRGDDLRFVRTVGDRW
jgi:hypothetical protein